MTGVLVMGGKTNVLDGVGDRIDVVTGLYVLTLSDDDITELEELEV